MANEAEQPRLSATLNAIWEKHRDLMSARLSAIDKAINAAADNCLDDETRMAAHRDAHKLAGALGTFGLVKGTDYARTIENALEENGTIDVQELRVAAQNLREQIESRNAN